VAKEGTKKVSRREFVKGAAVGAAGVAAAGALASCAPAATPTPTTAPVATATAVPAAAPTPVPEKWDYEADVVVAGAGNAGMCAALAAADGGAKTLLIEVSSITGGSALFSGTAVAGVLHTVGVRTWEDYNRYTRGLHDPVLGKVYVETFWNEYIPWLQSKDVVISRPTPEAPSYVGDWYFGPGSGAELGPRESNRIYFDSIVTAFEALGGTVMVKTRAVKLYTDDEGGVIGLMARVWSNSPLEENQSTINIKAKKTIVATGNFYGNKEMMTRYIGSGGYRIRPFGGPYQCGEGIAMAQAVGARMSAFLDTLSGLLCAITPTRPWGDDPEAYEEWLNVTTPKDYDARYHVGVPFPPFVTSGAGATAILVNLDGERFMDESNLIVSNQRRDLLFVLRQPQGEAWVIADQNAYDVAAAGYKSQIDAIIAEGGKVITDNTLEEFATKLEEEAGMYKAGLLKTIGEYNKAIDNGTTAELDPPRSPQEKYWKISKPPFYAIPVTATAYYTAGGLAINEDAQTLDMAGRPIPNLYSPPPCGGGIMNQIYTGGNGIAGTFGYRAGKHAAANL